MKPTKKPTYQELDKRINELQAELKIKQDYTRLYENSTISIWNEDFTRVYEQIEALRKRDIPDIKHYLKENPDVLFSLIEKLKINSVNKATLTLFKAESNHEFLSNIQRTFGDGADKVFTDLIEAIWNFKKSFTSEVNYKTLKGDEFAALFSIPFPRTKLEQRTVPVTIQSIQALKEAESAKRESLLKLQQAQKVGHIGSWEWEWKTDRAVWSDEMYRIYGVEKGEFDPTSENVGKTILEADKHKMENAISSILKGENVDSFEFKIVRPTNEIRDLSILAIQLSDGIVFGVTQDITERKKTENKLNEAQTIAKVGSWAFNPSSQKVDWSDEMFHIWEFDLTKGTPEYDTLVQRIHPDDLELWNSSVENATKLGIPYDIEHRISLPNGEHKVIRGICQPVLGVNGEVVGLAGTGQDITKQKLFDTELLRAKVKAEESEDYLNNIINNIGDPVFVKDDQFRMVLVNDSFCKLLGIPKNELIGKTMAEDLPAEQMEVFLRIDKQVLSDGIENLNEEVISHASGAELTIVTKKNRYVDDQNKSFIIAIIRDITEAKVIEKELADQNKKIHDLNAELNEAQTLAKVGNWSFSPITQKIEWSNETFHLLGFDLKNGAPEFDELVNRIHIDDRELFNTAVDQAIQFGTPYDIEHRACLPNGEQKVVRAICQPVLGANGEVISLVGTSQDITSHKQFEQAQVKHQRLKAMGEMSSSIAHDFNNSLQEMMGNLEIVKLQKDLSDSTLERLNDIGSIITDVADRVHELQKFSDTEHVDKNAKSLDLNTLIEESLNQSRPLWKDSKEKEGVTINVITDFEKVPKILCTGGEVKSAVYNLVKNSIEAMPKGGDLTIKTGVKTEGVFVTFTDTGVGMDEETKLKIFEPFYSTKGFKLGRGLGMSGVYSIVKKYKGDITVKSSELTEGTTIEIVFPVSLQGEMNFLSEMEPIENGVYNVLWVDDDFLISKSSRMLVESLGHTCNTANSGKKALEYLSENACDIVFTDIGMPLMNGWELADAIRHQFGDKVKIVAVTGWDIEESVQAEHDIDCVVQKPFSMGDLKKAFRVV